MSVLGIVGMILFLLAIGFGLLALEKIVKVAFGSWVVLGLSLGIGIGLKKRSEFLSLSPEVSILGMQQSAIAEFLLNAQPTIMLVSSGLLLWFFVSYGQLSLNRGEDLLQKILWAILAVGSVFSMVWVSLFTVGGNLYEWLFQQGDLASYGAWIPLFVIVMAVMVLFFASKVNIHLSFKASVSE